MHVSRHHLSVTIKFWLMTIDWCGARCIVARLFVRGEALGLDEGAGTDMMRVPLVEFVDNWVNHDSLLVDCQHGVRRHINPVLCVELASRLPLPITFLYEPRSNVKGSLATRTMSAPLSLRSIWNCLSAADFVRVVHCVPEE